CLQPPWPPATSCCMAVIPRTQGNFAREVQVPFQLFIWRPTNITDTSIVLLVDFPNLFWPGHEEEKINEKLGGLSGGPVFRIIERLNQREKRVYYELVGIVYEIHESWEVVRARHIQHVLADGSLVPV